jgi:hypothetical protein
MARYTRRRTLALSGIGFAGAIAGCVGDDTDDDGDPGGGATVEGTETVQTGTRLGRPDWHHDDEAVGDVVVMDSQERARAVLAQLEVPERHQDGVRTLLQETEFDSSLLVLVETVGPNTCYDEVSVSALAVEDGTLTGEASAVETSGDGEACGDAITYPSALVEVTFDGAVPTSASLSITDGWGDTETVTATASDPLSPDPDDLPGHVRPSGDPPAVPPALSCPDEDFERHPTSHDDEVPWGEAEPNDETVPFALRVDSESVDYGDTVTVTLTNVSDRLQGTGNRHKYNLEVRTEDGWQDVRGRTDGDYFGYTDEAISHAPGDGFEWTIELAEAGLAEGHYHEDAIEVCPDLPAGRYRFVFWEPTVAVAFDVER